MPCSSSTATLGTHSSLGSCATCASTPTSPSPTSCSPTSPSSNGGEPMSTAATEALLEELVPSAEPVSETDLARVLDVSVELKVEIGRTTMTIRELLDLAPGTVITLDRMAGEP